VGAQGEKILITNKKIQVQCMMFVVIDIFF
jgi:hypothetical protein